MSGPYTLVLGLGLTGASCVRFLAGHETVVAMDSRSEPPQLEYVRREFPNTRCVVGGFDPALIAGAARIIASPGIAGLDSLLRPALDRGVPVLSDIDLFAAQCAAPVLGITGTNGKSTVTALTGHLLASAGVRVAVGGNIGTPALDLLSPQVECYVLELSSFQLDVTRQLRCHAATILNITEDHLDRYADLTAYAESKQRIYVDAAITLWNRADFLTRPRLASGESVSFGEGEPEGTDYGVRILADGRWFCRGSDDIAPVSALRIRGAHNEQNALAAIALAHAQGMPLSAVRTGIESFEGLPHRCRYVATIRDVDFVNDSKATNIGACLAALAGVAASTRGKIVLIAGGDGKGADFAEFGKRVKGLVRKVITVGRDGPRIAHACQGNVDSEAASSLDCAVRKALAASVPGDCVLLAPACASLDQFRNFEHRGEVFEAAVRQLAVGAS